MAVLEYVCRMDGEGGGEGWGGGVGRWVHILRLWEVQQ